jgi:CBS domain-containing protein
MAESIAVSDILTVQNVMSRDVLILSPTARLIDAARELARRGVTGAPVCTSNGRLVGVLSHADLVSACFDEHTRVRATLVADAMSWPVMTIRADTPLEQAARLMLFEAVHRLIVVGARGEVVGIVTPLDLLRGRATAARDSEAMAG